MIDDPLVTNGCEFSHFPPMTLICVLLILLPNTS